MSARNLSRCLLILGTFALPGLFGGCNLAYPIGLRGVVRSAKDGAPIVGVQLTLSPHSYHGPDPFPIYTAYDGTFWMLFQMEEIGFDADPWSVMLSREGFRTEDLEIGRIERPTSNGPTVIVVVAVMREVE